MDKLNKYLRYTCFSLVVLWSSCIRDGQDPCPPEPDGFYSYIRFVYDYNMAFEDLFHRQVSNITLYLFDEEGLYLEKLTDECFDGATFPEGYLMGLPERYKDACQFVAFPGLSSEQFLAAPMTPGLSTIDDLTLQLHEKEINTIETSLKPLWHGCIAQAKKHAKSRISTRAERDDITTINLIKNTNSIRIALQSTDESTELDINEFSFCLEAVNNAYDAYNNPIGSDPWSFYPFYKENSENKTGGVVELHTMRLIAEQKNQLTITHLPTSTTILSINLNMYLDALKLQQYTHLSLQEYMDREDEYKILLFLTPTYENGMKWVATQLSINDWIYRDQENEF